jgi:colanic acid biosynthesis glycosyl transferase WcaI
LSVPTVWIVSELYYPEETSTGYFLTRIAEGIAARIPAGAVCARPTYTSRALRVPWRETHNGVTIIRCRATRLDPHKLISRAVNAVTITASMFFTLLRVVKQGQLVIGVTNPPTLPLIARAVCRMRGALCVMLVHDVYPEVPAAAGMVRRGGLAYRLVNAVAHWLYRSVDHVVVLGRDMARIAEAKGARRMTVIPNWGDVNCIRREERGDRSKFILQYGGNIGRTHDLRILLDAAAALAADPDVELDIVGGGACRDDVEREIAARGLHNVKLRPPVRREELSASLNAADVAVISMRAGMSGLSVPSRLYNMLAAGRPVIAIADDDSEIANVVREEEIGWVVPPGDLAALHAAIAEARGDPLRLQMMGRRARAAAEQKYTQAHVVKAYRELIHRLLAESRRHPGKPCGAAG